MAYPIKQGDDNRWIYTQVPNAIGGLNASASSDSMENNQFIQAENVRPWKNILIADSGYSTFGQVVVGYVQGTFEFPRADLTTDLMLITTSTVYKWSTALDTWILVKGTAGTTTVNAYPETSTIIVVASAAGFATGDLISIVLDDSSQLQTTITVAGTTFTLADGVPLGRFIALGAVVNRAVSLTGSLSYQISTVVIASHDWFVFTNGINIVQRYNGTDCVVVPNLPSAGNTICRAVALFNTALFLLNTTEGGVYKPQRARRSNQTDPTDWTTGTAGFDDLYDLPHEILRGEPLGPYLIIYRTNSITRADFYGAAGINYRFETVITAEGVRSTNSVANFGDFHLVVGLSNVYEYRGDYTLPPIGDNIASMIASYTGDLLIEHSTKLTTIAVDALNEFWILYPSTASANTACDVMLRYNLKDRTWHKRRFFNSITSLGEYAGITAMTWNDMTMTWEGTTLSWGNSQITANSKNVMLTSADSNQVYVYDYKTPLDNTEPISYTIETKDFILPDAEFRFDMIELLIQGSNIALEYSTDFGDTWIALATITQVAQGKVQVFKQVTTNRIRFKLSGNDPQFKLSWFGISIKVESIS